MVFTCCMGCGKCVWYSQAEGKESGSRMRQSRMKPFRRKNPVSGLRSPAEEGLTESHAEHTDRMTQISTKPASWIFWRWIYHVPVVGCNGKSPWAAAEKWKDHISCTCCKALRPEDIYWLCLEGWTMFNWFNSLAQARMMELNNEKIGCVVRQKKNRV